MKNQNIVVGTVIAGIVAVITLSSLFHQKRVNDFKTAIDEGSITLTCFINNKDKVITSDKIVDIDYDHMSYKFTNGSAKNCTVVKNNG